MPLEKGNRGHVDEDILSGLSKETFPPHLNLNCLGGMLNHLDNHHPVETAQETDDPLDGVNDQTSQDEGPRLCGVRGGGN